MNNFISGLMLVMGTFLLGLGIGVTICSLQFGERWWCGVVLCAVGVILELSLMGIEMLFGEKEQETK
jgi:polyferredoxin